jgi:hypothetical protein
MAPPDSGGKDGQSDVGWAVWPHNHGEALSQRRSSQSAMTRCNPAGPRRSLESHRRDAARRTRRRGGARPRGRGKRNRASARNETDQCLNLRGAFAGSRSCGPSGSGLHHSGLSISFSASSYHRSTSRCATNTCPRRSQTRTRCPEGADLMGCQSLRRHSATGGADASGRRG